MITLGLFALHVLFHQPCQFPCSRLVDGLLDHDHYHCVGTRCHLANLLQQMNGAQQAVSVRMTCNEDTRPHLQLVHRRYDHQSKHQMTRYCQQGACSTSRVS